MQAKYYKTYYYIKNIMFYYMNNNPYYFTHNDYKYKYSDKKEQCVNTILNNYNMYSIDGTYESKTKIDDMICVGDSVCFYIGQYGNNTIYNNKMRKININTSPEC